MKHPIPRLAALAVILLSAACVTTTSGQEERKNVSTSQWLQPSQVLRDQIADQLERLPWTHGVDRVEQIRWLAGVGEAGFDQILPVCLDPRPDVAGAALAALGATGDNRLVVPIQSLDWPPDDEMNKGLRLERARTLVRLGDWTHLRVLIEGLEDEELWTRAWSIQALFEATKHRFDYSAKGTPEERAASAQRWRAWLDSRQTEGLLPPGLPSGKS
jgi:hypothetical protein